MPLQCSDCFQCKKQRDLHVSKRSDLPHPHICFSSQHMTGIPKCMMHWPMYSGMLQLAFIVTSVLSTLRTDVMCTQTVYTHIYTHIHKTNN